MVTLDPHVVGGIMNYTRPLAEVFSELGHQVFTFYSGAPQHKYNWKFFPYLRINTTDFPFECAEVVNSPNWITNPMNPSLDVSSPKIERIFRDYINRVQPDIMHVHALGGLPVSLVTLASRRGIPVFMTLHVYEILCQKIVMMNKQGKPCKGPDDFQACVSCPEVGNLRKTKMVARINSAFPGLLGILVRIKHKLMGAPSPEAEPFSGEGTAGRTDEKKVRMLEERLERMISTLNHHVEKNICVSSDVRKTFIRFGVKPERLLVQHIGSTIAERPRSEQRALHNPLVFGNIGGVGYYKGQHILLEAVERVKRRDFKVKVFGKMDEAYLKKIIPGREHLPVEFMGKYEPEELPGILQQIDIMVLPSICSDTAPQTIFESFSAGIPVIGSDIGGFPDFVLDGINGYLFEPGNSGELARRMEMVLENPDVIHRFSENIPRLKTMRENARELLDMYEEALKNRGRARFPERV